MLRIDPVLAVATLVPFPLMAVVVSRFAHEVHRRSVRVQDQYGVLSNAAQENIAGIRVVQGYCPGGGGGRALRAREPRLHGPQPRPHPLSRALPGVDRLAARRRLAAPALDRRDARSSAAGDPGRAGRLHGVPLAAHLAVHRRRLGHLAGPARGGGDAADPARSGEEVPEIRGGPRARRPSRCGARSASRGSRSATAAAPRCSHGIDLVIPAGTVLAITGRTGSGKSTLLNLLPRLYDPTAGRVLLDGIDLRDWKLAELRAAIGVVPQEPFLFSDTLAENIRFGRSRRPDGGGAPRARRGARWRTTWRPSSGGSKRASASAASPSRADSASGRRSPAALLKDPPVLHPRRSALSSVDKSTEAELLRDLREVARGTDRHPDRPPRLHRPRAPTGSWCWTGAGSPRPAPTRS